jgi:hypothetical protein
MGGLKFEEDQGSARQSNVSRTLAMWTLVSEICMRHSSIGVRNVGDTGQERAVRKPRIAAAHSAPLGSESFEI